jgi:hypothetical protein
MLRQGSTRLHQRRWASLWRNATYGRAPHRLNSTRSRNDGCLPRVGGGLVRLSHLMSG